MRQILKLTTIGVLGVAIVFFALDSDQADLPAVSYTHLTLPTKA